jgi:hypothetical protein
MESFQPQGTTEAPPDAVGSGSDASLTSFFNSNEDLFLE